MCVCVFVRGRLPLHQGRVCIFGGVYPLTKEVGMCIFGGVYPFTKDVRISLEAFTGSVLSLVRLEA